MTSSDPSHQPRTNIEEDALLPQEEDFLGEEEQLDRDDEGKDSAEAVTFAKKELPKLGNDPIRLYFNEIGKVDLLDANQEFWLSARMLAIRRLDVIGRKHPISRRGGCPSQSMYRALFAEMDTAWQRVNEDIRRWHFECLI